MGWLEKAWDGIVAAVGLVFAGVVMLLYTATVVLIVGGIALGVAEGAGIIHTGWLDDTEKPVKKSGGGSGGHAGWADRGNADRAGGGSGGGVNLGTDVYDDSTGVDPTPARLDGSSSQEFEPDDIDRANSASDAVRDYCSGAVSEAQYVGCISHVDESDIP